MIPDLIAIIQAPDSNFQKRRRADTLLQSYIDMLIEIRSQQNEHAYGIDVVNEIFKLTDARYSQVGSALGESSARAASLADPELAELVRQEQLSPEEALIAIWTLEEKTCVWAIPHLGNTAFTVVDLGEETLRKKVGRLRQALRPSVRMLSEIPEFDLDTAFEIYDRLLHPVESGWGNARSLVVVVKGPLDQIPLAVLPTEKVKPVPDSTLRFDKYRKVP